MELVEAGVVYFVNDYKNDKYEGTFEIHPSMKTRCVIVRADKDNKE